MEEDKKDWERCLIDYYRETMHKYMSDSSHYQLRYYSEIENKRLFLKRMWQTFSELDTLMTDNNIECKEMRTIIKYGMHSCSDEMSRGVKI